MSMRKMLMVCVVAMAVILPLFGCNGQDAGGAAGDGASESSNTTATE